MELVEKVRKGSDISCLTNIRKSCFPWKLGLGRRVDVVNVIVVPNRKWWYLRRLRTAPPTQRRCINAAAAVCQFFTVGHSHRAKHRWNKDEPLCNSHRKLHCRFQRDEMVNVMMMTSVCLPGVSPVNLNPQTVYNA